MNKRMTFLLLYITVLMALVLPACSYEQLVQQSDTDYGSRRPNDPKMLGNRAYGKLSNDANQHNNSFFEYSSMVSRKVTSLDGVASAIVILTDKNAYVALMLDWTAVGTTNGGTEGQVYTRTNNTSFYVNDHNKLSDELKQTVATVVRKEAPAVEEVHISANMEFVNSFNGFATEAWGGRPLMPWLEKFNAVVQTHFGDVTTQPHTYNKTNSQRLTR